MLITRRCEEKVRLGGVSIGSVVETSCGILWLLVAVPKERRLIRLEKGTSISVVGMEDELVRIIKGQFVEE